MSVASPHKCFAIPTTGVSMELRSRSAISTYTLSNLFDALFSLDLSADHQNQSLSTSRNQCSLSPNQEFCTDDSLAVPAPNSINRHGSEGMR